MDKPTWVFSCGMYRTASTTHYEMTRDIVELTGNGVGIGYHQEKKLHEFDAPTTHRYVVCKVFEFLPGGFRDEHSHGEVIRRERRLKACATIRDPRDIIVSMRERHRRQMEDPARQAVPFDFKHRAEEEFPAWLSNLHKWIGLGPSTCLLSRYEVWTNNRVEEVRRIADHLEIDLTRDQVRGIAGDYTLKAIVDRKKASRTAKEREDPWLPSIPGPLFGTSGAHKEYLSEKEENMLVRANRVWIRRYGYL